MRRSFINILVFLVPVMCGLVDGGQAVEQYPVKPIYFIIPLEAGSDGDIMCRPLCQNLSTILGQPVVVVNKPGAGSSIGFREIREAKPDGYTVGEGFAGSRVQEVSEGKVHRANLSVSQSNHRLFYPAEGTIPEDHG